MLKKTKVTRTAKQHYTKKKRQKHSNTKNLLFWDLPTPFCELSTKILRSSESCQQNPENSAPVVEANLVRWTRLWTYFKDVEKKKRHTGLNELLTESLETDNTKIEQLKQTVRDMEFWIENLEDADVCFYTEFLNCQVCNAVLTYLKPGTNGGDLVYTRNE